jgi:hypothetical protein
LIAAVSKIRLETLIGIKHELLYTGEGSFFTKVWCTIQFNLFNQEALWCPLGARIVITIFTLIMIEYM